MKTDELNCIGFVDDNLIEESDQYTSIKKKSIRLKRGLFAACFVLILTVGAMGVVFAAENKEYRIAVGFFEENGLSTEGLNRSEVKEVYRDITQKKFSSSITAEVLKKNITGLEIFQPEPSAEDLENAWNNWIKTDYSKTDGIHFEKKNLYRRDDTLGFKVFDKTTLTCYRNEDILWTADFSDFIVSDAMYTTSGTVVWGFEFTYSSEQGSYGWIARVDDNGTILWETRVRHDFRHEPVDAVLQNDYGTYAVFTHGDYKYICLSQYDANGNEIAFYQTEITAGIYGLRGAARIGDDYLLMISSSWQSAPVTLIRMEKDGKVTDNYTYESEDCEYRITDMLEYEGQLYLSAYSYPKQKDEGGRDEIADILDYCLENFELNSESTSETLTQKLRDNYTAVLLVCDNTNGTPKTFYSVKGSVGGELFCSEEGNLTWKVDNLTNAFFSPFTSAYSIAASGCVVRYTFDKNGNLLSQEETDEVVSFTR